MGLFNRFLDALYPQNIKCTVCGAELRGAQELVCDRCRAALMPCADAIAPEGTDGFRAGLLYTGAVVDAIHRFKYDDARYMADFLAAYMQIPPEWNVDMLIPVPLHRAKRSERGYNQSELLCRKLSERTGIRVCTDMLLRTRNTVSQTALSAQARCENLKDAFKLAMPCDGKRILLVDDVRTTGSTFTECALTLKAAGAAAVYSMAACAAEIKEL
ncbi:MAG: ComF family protein [Clostridia bacterium]